MRDSMCLPYCEIGMGFGLRGWWVGGCEMKRSFELVN